MNNEKNRAKYWLTVSSVALAALALPGCGVTHEEVCPTYACLNGAQLQGTAKVAETVTMVDAEYCSELGCVDGTVDLAAASAEPVCTQQHAAPYDDAVCFRRSAAGELEVKANLTRAEDGTLPADGERYTLRVVDHDSGEVLIDETRRADYEVTREDTCHVCWSADMAL
jgi:hypothetical protein